LKKDKKGSTIMKTIKIPIKCMTPETIYCAENASHKATRDLVGYAVHTGRICDPIVGSAMELLKEILALAPNELYQIQHEAGVEFDQVVAVAEAVLNGNMAKFRMSKRVMARNRELVAEKN
jgi:hypothetical protein